MNKKLIQASLGALTLAHLNGIARNFNLATGKSKDFMVGVLSAAIEAGTINLRVVVSVVVPPTAGGKDILSAGWCKYGKDILSVKFRSYISGTKVVTDDLPPAPEVAPVTVNVEDDQQ